MGRKFLSIYKLGKMGLNVPESLMDINPYFCGRPEARRRLGDWILLRKNLFPKHRVSIRTEKEKEFKSPHLPNITLDEVAKKVPELIEKYYIVEIFEGIDPADCKFKGNLAGLNDGRWILEYKDGPGTVREMDNDRIIHYHWTDGSTPDLPPELKQVVDIFKDNFNEMRNQILEWSIYKHPVGKKNENLIFWELRPWQ